MPKRVTSDEHARDPVIDRLDRRIWPIVVSVAFVALGLAYFFRWGSVVRHVPSLWLAPADLGGTYGAATALAHGQFGAVYQGQYGFLAFPGFLLLLAPLGALSNTFHGSLVEIAANHHALAHPRVYLFGHIGGLNYLGPSVSRGNTYVFHPQAFVAVVTFALMVSCSALFSCDALAERLEITRSRRAALCVAEAVILWNTVVWGHPEDALAVALAVYALIFAMDERFTAAGWLFGAALAVQPLVMMTFPIILVLGGKKRAVGLVVRGSLPVVVVTAGPLIANVHASIHALVTQPAFPNYGNLHQTPWTFLAPKLQGVGATASVGGGPTRLVVVVLAAGVGWWAVRWRARPEMIVWAVALSLALRIYLETVMADYYCWPALAVALVVAARCSRPRFATAVVLAIAITVVAQWSLGWLPWWALDAAGVAALLVVSSRPEPLESDGHRARKDTSRSPVSGRPRSGKVARSR